MDWDQLYGADDAPTMESIEQFVGSGLWRELNADLQETYGVQPILSYSSCSMQRGWNIKYQKGGRSLCTLYPMKGSFIALVVIGRREKTEAELALPLFSDDFRQLYRDAAEGMGQKWLMIPVKNRAAVDDVKRCVAIRRSAK